MPIHKDAEALAQRIRAQGFECECRDGHAFIVWKKGSARILARFSASTSSSIGNKTTLRRVVADLRRAGVLPRTRHEESRKKRRAKERKEAMPMVTEAERQRTPIIVGMIRGTLMDMGGDTLENRLELVKQAVASLSGRRDVSQFGSGGVSNPQDVASNNLRNLLDKQKVGTTETLDRWEKALVAVRRELVGRENGQPAEVETVQTEETDKKVITVELDERLVFESPPELAAEIERLRGDLESSEALLHEAGEKLAEAQRERDQARRDRESAQVQIERLIEVKRSQSEQLARLRSQDTVIQKPVDEEPSLSLSDVPASLRIAIVYRDPELALEVYRLEMTREGIEPPSPIRRASSARRNMGDVIRIDKKTIRRLVVDRVASLMRPGKVYSATEMAELAGVSSNTVRLALKVLEREAAVEQKSSRLNRGQRTILYGLK
jgi:DNA-binding transcriptional regulator YhcF (GntR family)